jgi:galactoside O-acetyltransferase
MDNKTNLNLVDQVGANTDIDSDLEIILFNRPAHEKRGLFIGSSCTIYSKNRIVFGDMQANPDANMIIGNNVMINAGCYLSAEGGLEIEDFVLIGPNSNILSAGHNYSDPTNTIQNQRLSYGKIIIKKDVWIGASCVLLQGITIGEGAVIGAGSVVTRDIPSMAVAVGNPAKVVKFRSLNNNFAINKNHGIHRGYQDEIKRLNLETAGIHEAYQLKINDLHKEMADVHKGYNREIFRQKQLIEKQNQNNIKIRTPITLRIILAAPIILIKEGPIAFLKKIINKLSSDQ